MSRPGRHLVTAAVPLLVAACASGPTATPASTLGVTVVNTSTTPVPSSTTSGPPPPSSPPSTVAPSTVATTTSPPACPTTTVVVIGNSTDYWPNLFVGRDEPSSDAWPALVAARLTAEHPELPVDLRNESGKGAGHDVGLQGVNSMYDILGSIVAAGVEHPAVLILAPSVVDLQLKDRDVDDSFAAFVEIVELGSTAFDVVFVAPMHPVTRRQGEVTARAVADFNARLAGAGVTAGYDRSVLLSGDDLFGRPDLYDDFDDERLDTPESDPDGIHPDADGHRAVADAVTPFVVDAVAGLCGR